MAEPASPPARMPGVMRFTTSQRTTPRLACARVLDTEVNRIVAIPVPTARWSRCSRGRPCASKSHTSSGIISAPPPMPSIPAKKPAAAPTAR